MTCRGQILTTLQEGLRNAQALLSSDTAQQVPRGSAVTVIDGAGRRMPATVVSHGDGCQAGYLRVLPLNHKYPEGHRRHWKCIRTVHWTQLDLEVGNDD